MPTTVTTQPSTNECAYPEDKLNCEHICDTYVYECITNCNHDTRCKRDCWIEHDRCAINCPCNAECPDGCPEPYDGHHCITWFCQGYIETCATENDPDREQCIGNNQYECEMKGCCWVPYSGNSNGQNVMWCHYPKKIPILP